MKRKILLTGASGFLGHYLCLNQPNDVQLIGQTHAKNAPKNIKSHQCNLSEEKSIIALLKTIQPQGIIHTAAISNPAQCQQDKDYSKQVNVQASLLLAKYSAEHNIPFVFTSTDLVFDGEKGNYQETDLANPLNIYGEQKLLAENEILQTYPKAAVCRMPLMLGNAPGFPEKFLQQFIAKLQQGKRFSLFTDEYRSVMGATSGAKALWLALEKMHGLYHLGGPERLSRSEIGYIIVEKYGLDKSLIDAIKQSDLQLSTPRPKDVSLDSSKAAQLGFNPKKIALDLD